MMMMKMRMMIIRGSFYRCFVEVMKCGILSLVVSGFSDCLPV
jgi:hypothetical protein